MTSSLYLILTLALYAALGLAAAWMVVSRKPGIGRRAAVVSVVALAATVVAIARSDFNRDGVRATLKSAVAAERLVHARYGRFSSSVTDLLAVKPGLQKLLDAGASLKLKAGPVTGSVQVVVSQGSSGGQKLMRGSGRDQAYTSSI